MDLQLCVPCLFGLEGLAADELKRLGMKNVRAENGRVLFDGSETDIARANINLRTGERVLLVVGRTPARSFNELFEGVKAMPWELFVPPDGNLPVKGHSLNSALRSVPDCQSIIKKAIVERLKSKYRISWLSETGAVFRVQFSIMSDDAWLFIDTSGSGLHKRGYRPVGSGAPLRETLAAAVVILSRYRGREEFCDPFCGSGTIPIEAALVALNRAPGLGRTFAAQAWKWLDRGVWKLAAQEARDREYRGRYEIWGGDIDPRNIAIASENARNAGVDLYIRFEVGDAADFARARPGGVLATNPPYGERLLDRQGAELIYRRFGEAAGRLSGWRMYILSSHPEFERHFGRKAVKKRKLYNGMIKCNLFMYY